MDFFTADQHFCHKQIITYCKRPFNDVDKMNEVMVKRWNETVVRGDTIYVIGDLILCNNKNYAQDLLNSLHGRIILINGDHDAIKGALKNRFHFIDKYYIYRSKELPEKMIISLFHWAQYLWQKSHFNSWHLFGHSHGKCEGIGKSFDVGVDCNDFRPVSLDKVKEIMCLKPDNPNKLKEPEEKFKQEEISFSWNHDQ